MFLSQDCFSDKWIKSIIRGNNTLGKCNYSELESTYVIDMDKFLERNKEIIRQFFHLYEYEFDDKYLRKIRFVEDMKSITRLRKNINIKYDSLLNLIQRNWNFFDLEKITENKAYEVLLYWYNEINQYKMLVIEDLKDEYWYDIRYKYWGYFVKEDWDFIRFNMVHNFRYNPEKIPKLNFEIDKLFSFKLFSELICLLPKGDIIYRGRIKEDINGKFKNKEMLIPPFNIKSVGRANPVGINYLYVADSPKTVIAEVRAWKDSIVSVASLELKEDFVMVDLTWMKPLDSFFDSTLYNDLNLTHRIECCEMAILLGQTLSQPINPRESDLEYIFTQYLCERIRSFENCFNGIKFKSSLCDGTNYVIFSDEKIRVKSIHDYTVEKINYEIAMIEK